MGEKGQQWRNVVSRRPGSEICEGPVVTPFGGGGNWGHLSRVPS